jgi:PAS domain S-box-containing protein
MENKNLPAILKLSPFGYAYHEVIFDTDGQPVDYRFLAVNEAFEKLTGLDSKIITGKTVTEAIPGIEKSEFDWISFYGTIALNNGNEIFEQYSEPLGKWYNVHVYSIEKGFFTTIFHDITKQRETEKALTDANERLHRFIDTNIIGVLIATPSGRVDETNDYYLNLIGYSREEYKQGIIDWRKITPPEWIAADEKAIKELREKGVCAPYEKEYIRRDGTRVSVFLYDAMLPGPEEQIVAFAIDITQRKKAENAIIDSEKRYRGLFENMYSGFVLFEVITDETGKPEDLLILAANKVFEITTGLNPDQVTGKKLSSVLPGIENDKADWIGTYGRVALNGKSMYLEQGSELLGTYYTVAAFQPAPNQCAVTFIDITKRRNAEEALRREMDFSEKSLNSLPGVFYCYNKEFKFQRWNKNFETVTGYSSEEIVNMSPLDFFDDETKKAMLERINEVFEKGASSIEADFVSKDGTRTPYYFTGIVTEINNENHLVGVGIDITERKEAVRKMAEQLTELQKWHDFMLNREDRVMELKKEVNSLLEKSGQAPRYSSEL